MTQFGGSLRFVKLPAVTQLLAELRSTGRLCVSYGEWLGEIIVRQGQIVEARIADERGRAALEAIVVALSDGAFSFVGEPVAETSEVLVTEDERALLLERLTAEHERLIKVIPSLGLIPRLADAPNASSVDAQLTIEVRIEAGAVQLLPALVSGRTLDQLARERGLMRTLRAVHVLVEGGLLELEQPGPRLAAAELAVEKLAAGQSGPVPRVKAWPLTRRPVTARPIAVEESAAPLAAASAAQRGGTARRFAWTHAPAQPQPATQPRLVTQLRPEVPLQPATPPVDVTLVEPTIPPGVAARLAAARQFNLHPATPPHTEPGHATRFTGVRKAIVGFFVSDAQGV